MNSYHNPFLPFHGSSFLFLQVSLTTILTLFHVLKTHLLSSSICFHIFSSKRSHLTFPLLSGSNLLNILL